MKNAIKKFNLMNDAHICTYGRVRMAKYKDKNTLRLTNTASGFEVVFEGTECRATIASKCRLEPGGYLKIIVDGKESKLFLDGGECFTTYVLAESLPEGMHTLQVYKVIEEDYGSIYMSALSGENIRFYPASLKTKEKIMFFGDSITAGYGALGKSGDAHTAAFEDGTVTYAFKTAQGLNLETDIICMQGISLAIPIYQRVVMKDYYDKDSITEHEDWEYSTPAEYIVINLGTNDHFAIEEGKGTVADFINVYKTFIANLRKSHPNAYIICCYGMMVTSLNIPIQAMVDELNVTDGKIFACPMIRATGEYLGVNGHPRIENHEENADVLIALLKRLRA